MLHTEYIRNLNCNYQRILLDEKPEDNRYQYCMINRGGIKGLLSCSLRYLNGLAYLYYDITSTQNVSQIFSNKAINRSWMKDFLWSMQQVHLELSRFLLDDRNVLWHPDQIFQDVEKNDFSYMYIPYYDGDNGFLNLIEFWVEHIDYEDEVLVECIYKMHEQYEFLGSVYLQEQIFEDAKVLDRIPQILAFDPNQEEIRKVSDSESGIFINTGKAEHDNSFRMNATSDRRLMNGQYQENAQYQENGNCPEKKQYRENGNCPENKHYSENGFNPENGQYQENTQFQETGQEGNLEAAYEENRTNKRGIFYLLEGKRRKQKEYKESLRKEIKQKMEGLAVSEDTQYQDDIPKEDFGKTIYIEETEEKREIIHGLYNREGKKTAEIIKTPFIIGKKKEESDLVLEDNSISRIHARIIKENDTMYIEDMNSTNGTFKNGLRMQPYEKKPLEQEDEIKIGKKVFFFREVKS